MEPLSLHTKVRNEEKRDDIGDDLVRIKSSVGGQPTREEKESCVPLKFLLTKP